MFSARVLAATRIEGADQAELEAAARLKTLTADTGSASLLPTGRSPTAGDPPAGGRMGRLP
jgi:hypothetical protein